ncbi:MAG: Fur family transcriptional regulator [Clostridium celatum]|nr:Fur family transcriptional regulator [Clostridium celatum]
MSNETNFNEILKSNGLKITKHRTSVLKIISRSDKPITAEEIYLNLKDDNISINLSSIYKILDSLCNKNIISKCVLGVDNKTSYEMTSSEHKHHLICKNCKGVFYIGNCPICEYEKSLHENMDFDVTEHRLEIYGYCKNCKMKRGCL